MNHRVKPTPAELGLSNARWRKSSFSGSTSNCVEVTHVGGFVAVRDSKNPDGPALVFTRREFVVFLDGARRGTFDDLA